MSLPLRKAVQRLLPALPQGVPVGRLVACCRRPWTQGSDLGHNTGRHGQSKILCPCPEEVRLPIGGLPELESSNATLALDCCCESKDTTHPTHADFQDVKLSVMPLSCLLRVMPTTPGGQRSLEEADPAEQPRNSLRWSECDGI